MVNPYYIQVRFSEDSPVYTYVAEIEQVENLDIGDYIVVPVVNGMPKVVQVVGVYENPPVAVQSGKIPLKWMIQRVDPKLIKRSITRQPFLAI